MSIFKESFPQFVIDELDRRQTGMFARTPGFLQELNTRSAWVRMTSGVNTLDSKGGYSKELAEKYILQGGTLLNNTSLRKGLGSNSTSTYDLFSPGGTQQRLGIRPMPGITGVSVVSKGAYGSLQEATVSFIAWDIKQLEELELLYMRPGYTVLLEFGWNYIKPTIPQYDILNKKEISLNKAFAEIYNIIRQSNGNYNALLGYVKNYNWSARDDGGYDCTTTIISLGEVLESLKCNWIPIETVAFSKTGILSGAKDGFGRDIVSSRTNTNKKSQYPDNSGWEPYDYYEQGIIPGLLAELFRYMDKNANSGDLTSYAREVIDPKYGNKYQLFMIKRLGDLEKFNRGGLPRHLTDSKFVEGYITLGSFCDLLNNYVLLKDKKDNPLSQVTTYELSADGVPLTETLSNKSIVPRSLRCLANPLSLSTNYGICLVRNNTWAGLNATVTRNEAQQDTNQTEEVLQAVIPNDIRTSIQNISLTRGLTTIGRERFIPKISERNGVYSFSGNIEETLEKIITDLTNAIVAAPLKDRNGDLVPEFIFLNENSPFKFLTTVKQDATKVVNFFDYFYVEILTDITATGVVNTRRATLSEQIEETLKDFFGVAYNKDIFDSTGKKTNSELRKKIETLFTKAPLSPFLAKKLVEQTGVAAANVAEAAADVPGLTSNILPFLVENATENGKSLGYISNIYVNMDFLFDQAISKNVASNDVQGKNTISIREYIQNILRQVQNSIGGINTFDIQVDERNAIGRIIDINYTGNPGLDTYQLEIHNLNSTVRNYNFQSKIFPEMGSIIAISAQDPTAVGKFGYDNATLIAWNEGVQDRLIPKKDFSPTISLGETNSPDTFILPFLSKIYTYFKSLEGQGTNNKNLSYGGLDYSYRDFLANLNRFNPQNRFSAIIPTELSVEMDGIAGIVIGNVFTTNQDIIPKGYKSVYNRKLGYIVLKLNHNIQNNDWITNIVASPVILDSTTANPVWKQWDNNKYPDAPTVTLTDASGKPIVAAPVLDAYIPKDSAIPVVKYLQGLGRKNGELLKDDLKSITKGVLTNKNHQLFPSATYQWGKLVDAALKAGFTLSDIAISDTVGAAYRPLNQQQEGPSRAPAGSSIHGWGAAVDIQSLLTYQRSFTNIPVGTPPADAAAAAKVRAGSKFYQWLNDNAANYGWINPPKLKDGSGEDEAWHWEYWGPINGPDGAFTGGRIGQAEVSPSSVKEDPQYIATLIRNATSRFNTDEQGIVNAINLVKTKNELAQVSRLLGATNGLQNILNSALGVGDRGFVEQIKTKLATLDVTLTYVPFSNNSIAGNSIKIVF